MKIIECVPNFSEGVDLEIIKKITNEIEQVKNVQLLDVDPGKDTNRTVVTFIGQIGNGSGTGVSRCIFCCGAPG